MIPCWRSAGLFNYLFIGNWAFPILLLQTRLQWISSDIYLYLCMLSCFSHTLCDPRDGSPPGSSVQGVLQARILEWVAMPSSRGSSQPRDQIQVSCIAGGFFTVWAIREALLVACYAFSPKNRPFGQMFFPCSERFWAVKITDEYRHFQQCRNIEKLSSIA